MGMNNFCFHLLENMIQAVILLAMFQNVVSKGNIFGQIKTDTSFYFQKLSKYPSALATIEYMVSFNKTNIELHCVNGTKCVVRLGIYTTEDDPNLRTNCSNNGYGQLRNKNLHTHLYNRGKPYRFTTCKLDDVDLDMLNCEGRISIQDYESRHYGFSFGYHCRELVRPSSLGLSYNFTISRQTNRTRCIKIPKHDKELFNCVEYYEYTSLPNLIGDLNSQNIKHWMNSDGISLFLGLISTSHEQLCYKYFKELICRIAYPECDPEMERVVHICRRTCYDFLEACLKSMPQILQKLSSAGFPFTWKWREPINSREELDCDYLPSLNCSIPCFYRPVTCDPPPNVTNARIINRIETNETYHATSEVEYECLKETFQMEGNSTVTCLYSGLWTETPRCPSLRDNSSANPLLFVIPILIIPLCLWIILNVLVWSRNNKERYVHTRNKEYDAFVCYDIADADYAHGTIIDELEVKSNPKFKLCIHKRDFKPSYTIKWNIWNAIKNSNSAIIVMSQSYVDSMWCRDEFEGCYVENLEDPAFRLFVIMMQPMESLQNTNEYMKSFFASKTYLEKDDPKIFERIAQYLNWLKIPETNDCKEGRQTNEINNRKAPNTEILEMFLTSM